MSGTATTSSEPAGPPVTTRRRPGGWRRWRGYVYVLPALVFYVTFAVFPAFHTAYLSLFDWDGVSLGVWVGLSNYAEVFSDPMLYGAVLHALVLVIFFSWIPIIIGLLMTGLLSRHRRRGMTLFRLLLFLPQVVPLVAVGVTWRWMYQQDGVVNQAFRLIGLDGITRDRKSTRLNSSHVAISYAVFCLKKKKRHLYNQSTETAHGQ